MNDKYISLLSNYFHVGRVIYSSYWMKYDKVLAFNVPGIGQCDYSNWSVTVATCDKEGNVIGEAREHCTAPMPEEIKKYRALK